HRLRRGDGPRGRRLAAGHVRPGRPRFYPPGRDPGGSRDHARRRLRPARRRTLVRRRPRVPGRYPDLVSAGRVVTAALVVVPGPDGTVTFVRQERGPYAGWWLLPGGKVEFGEPVAAAARREAAEESGCDPGELTLTGLLTGETFAPSSPQPS